MATIRDVAKVAGVSVATVSRVMNEKGYVHEDTVKQVKQAIEELNYRPNAVAKALFKKSSTIIAILVPNLRNPSYITLLRFIEESAYQEGYQVIVCSVENKRNYIDILSRNHIAGILMTEEVFREVGEVSVPFTVIDAKVPLFEYYQSAKKAVTMLKEKGCHFLAYIGEKDRSEEMEEHISGFLDAVWEEEIPYRVETLEGATEKRYQEVLRKYPYVDGIVASSDKVAISIIRAANSLGIHIPNELQVIGFKGSMQGEWINPSLSTIENCYEKRVVYTLQQLVGKIKKKQVKHEVVKTEFVFIERESTK
ncbi:MULTISPECIES: LacI family DNA-binding transcriptional regulator [unclassified Bacillus cereus group]|uniref:LacI family DNA-binding transcriptional regulator n=1 Tax=unclassified Bacillus cereus group TaxID=2750818 RepID=UPI001F59609F|nr:MULTISPECIES: LacI family DNA-binding transcriptional regulator [unclassified Bacillus cereus group]